MPVKVYHPLDSKADIKIDDFGDTVQIKLLSEDAVAWAAENVTGNYMIGTFILVSPIGGRALVERMVEDGLTTL